MRHDHRSSCWLIAGGAIIWCYRCGAWRMNEARDKDGKRYKWHRPTGPNGHNPWRTA